MDGVRLEEADLGANIIFSGEAGVRVLADEPISLCFLCVARNLFTYIEAEPRRNKKNLQKKQKKKQLRLGII